MTRRREIGALVAVALAAVALRLLRLGELSFAGDEETTTLAALALAEGWPPTLPGGLVYLRGLPFTLLEAVVVAVAGVDEFALRLVPALAAGPRVVAAWWLARPFVGGAGAVGVAALLAVTPFDVEISRIARMYSLFTLLDVVFLALVVRLVQTGLGALTAWLAGTLSVLTHGLGVMHVPLLFLAALAPGVTARRAVPLVGVGLGTLLAFGLREGIMSFAYTGVPGIETAGEESSIPPLAHLQRVGEIFEQPLAAAVALLGALGCIGLAVAGVRRLGRGAARLAAAVTTLAWLGASPVFAATGLLVTLILARLPLRALVGEARWLLASGAVATGGWCAAGVLAHRGALGATGDLVLGFPAPNWFEFALAGPGLFGLGLVGVLVATDRAARAEQPGAWLVLIGAALAPALLTGLFARHEALRYHVHAVVPFLILAVLGAHACIARFVRDPAASLVVALALTAVAVRPDEALRAVFREHGPMSEPFAEDVIAPDHRGAAAFVRAHAAPGEWIAAEDPLQMRLYAGRADVWLRQTDDAAGFLTPDPAGGAPRDIYAGARHVGDLDALRELAAAEGRPVVWLVTSGEVEARPAWYRTPETDARLRDWRPLAWYVAADGVTSVYRLEHGEPVAPGSAARPSNTPP